MKSYGSSVTWWTVNRGDTDEIWPSTKSRIDWTSDARSFEIFSLEYCTTLRKRSFFNLVLFVHILRIRYLSKKGVRAQILLGFFIPHWGLLVAKRWALKALNTWRTSLVRGEKLFWNKNVSIQYTTDYVLFNDKVSFLYFWAQTFPIDGLPSWSCRKILLKYREIDWQLQLKFY